MRTIEKKTWPELFKKVQNGEKSFDVRLNEFRCKKGDILYLREWDPKTKNYTGRTLKKKVEYVLKTRDLEKFWSKNDIIKRGFIIMSFK